MLVAVLAVPALLLGGSWWDASSKTPEPVAAVTTASTGVPLNFIINATNNGQLDNQSYSQNWNWS